MHPVPVAVGWLIWGGATIAIIRLDARRQAALAEARGEEDFKDRSPWTYLALALLLGPLPLIIYFVSTRKGGRGWLLGLGTAIVVAAASGGVVALVSATIARPPPEQRQVAFPLPPELGVAPVGEDEARQVLDRYVPLLRAVAQKAAPLCANRRKVPIDMKPSPARDTALERDAATIQVAVWCRAGGGAFGFDDLRKVADAEPGWLKRVATHADPETRGVVTLTMESPRREGANQLTYLMSNGDESVEVILEVRAR